MSDQAEVRSRFRMAGEIALLAAAYYLLGTFSFSLAVTTQAVTPVIFLAEGVSLAAVILRGRRIAPGIFLGQFLLAWDRDVALVSCLAFGVVNTAEAMLGAWLFERLRISRDLAARRDVWRFLALVTVVLQTFSATLGTLSLVAIGSLAWADLPFNWFCWWLGNSLGQLVMAPAILTWRRPIPFAGWTWLVVLSAIAAIFFGWTQSHDSVVGMALETTFLLLYLGIANRYGTPGAIRAALLVTIIGLAAARLGLGNFATMDSFAAMLHLSTQLFLQLCASLIVGGTIEELRASRRFSDTILENIPDMVFVKDARDLRFLRINRAGEDLTGIARADLIGKNDYDFFPKEQADFFTAKDRAVLESGSMVDIPEEEIRTRDQGVRMLHTKKIPVFGENDRPAFLVGISEDITQRKKAELAAISRLRKEASIGRIAAATAHEVNNPLATITFWLKSFQTRVQDSPDLVDGITLVRQQVDRIAGAARTLLGFARHRAGAGNQEMGAGEILQNIVQLYRGSLESRGIALEYREEGTLPMVRGQVEDFQEVLVNLLENAKELLPTGRRIRVEAHADKERLVVTVTDDGTGLGPDPGKCFEPFYTTRPEGTGIGLTYSRALCRLYGGDLVAENHPEGGARFTVTLPVNDAGAVSLAVAS